MKRIFLLGFMGAGKTTLGKAFSKAMQLEFIDLDNYIEGRFHKTVRQIFEDRGEEGFRQIEKNMLHEVAEFEDVVVSVGGGTPCFFDNMEYMNRQGQTVYLKCSDEVLTRRLKLGRDKRPLLKGKSDEELMDYVHQTVTKRAIYYEQAQLCMDGGFLESRQQISDSIEELRKVLGM